MPLFSQRSKKTIEISDPEDTSVTTGYLHKEGGNVKDFRKRWFVLKGRRATYFKDENDVAKGASAKGDLVAIGVGHIHTGSKQADTLDLDTVPNSFWVDAEGGRRFVLFAETYSEKLRWIKAFGCAIGKTFDETYVPLDERFATKRDDPASPQAWQMISAAEHVVKAGEHAAAQVALERVLMLGAAEGANGECKAYVRYQLGRMLVSKGALAEATQHLEAACAEPAALGWLPLQLQLAWCYGLVGRRDESLALYNRVLDVQPLCAPAFLDRAQQHIRTQGWQAALGDLSHAEALGRADANVLNDIGVCRFELGDVPRALEKFSEALVKNPNHAPSYSNRANSYRRLGKTSEAEGDYTKAIEIDDSNPKAYISRGGLRESVGQREAALADYLRVVELAPQHEHALKKVLVLTSDLAMSATHSGLLYKKGHLNTKYQKRYFLLHGAMLTYGESLEAITQGKAKGNPILARVTHVRSNQVAGQLSAEQASLAFSFESVEGKSFVVYAESAEEKLQWLTHLSKAVGGGKKRQRLTAEKAFASQLTAAEKAVVEGGTAGSSADGAKGGWAMVVQAMKLAKKGGADADEARSLLARAVDRSEGPASGVAVMSHALLGKLLSAKGSHREASGHFEKAVHGAPRTCEQHLKLQLAWSSWHSGRQVEAEEIYHAVLDDDVLCWQALLDRARMHLGMGAWRPALCDLRLVVAMGKTDSDVHNDLGVSYFELGEDERAEQAFNASIEANPANAPAISVRVSARAFGHRARHRSPVPPPPPLIRSPECARMVPACAEPRQPLSAAGYAARGGGGLHEGDRDATELCQSPHQPRRSPARAEPHRTGAP